MNYVTSERTRRPQKLISHSTHASLCRKILQPHYQQVTRHDSPPNQTLGK